VKQFDTNAVVRLLVEDDAAQLRRLRLVLSPAAPVAIASTVLLETIWVLQSRYSVSRADIIAACRKLAGSPSFFIGEPGAVAELLRLWDAGLELEDALHLAFAGEAEALLTFDQEFVRRARKAKARTVVAAI